MSRPKSLPDRLVLAGHFTYDRRGFLVRKSGPMAGSMAGTIESRGYVKVCIGREQFRAHRIIWKLFHGTEPEIIDHINGNRSDNRIENLRSVDLTANARSARRHKGVSNYKGVYAAKGGRWGARIKANSRTLHLGTFDCEAVAAFAYDLAARKFHGDFAITNECLGLLSAMPRSAKGKRPSPSAAWLRTSPARNGGGAPSLLPAKMRKDSAGPALVQRRTA